MTENEKIAELLFPNIKNNAEYYVNKYGKRSLASGAIVTRFAPSPTGYVHMGSLLTAFYDYIFAKQSNGVFYLRIEDTDLERTIVNGVEGIITDLDAFGVNANEGVNLARKSTGKFGPYVQTERKEIYQAFAKELVKKGLAYPCFCTKEELDKIREKQEKNKEVQIGYYGKYATCRNLTYEQIKNKIDAGLKYVIRFKAQANIGDRVKFNDKVRGEIEMADLVNDVVILKSDTMLPPYNLAHAVDDTLMGTTVVIRSNEWLNSVPEHMQLFKALGFEVPEYAHVAFVQKIDEETGTKRKISKRKDPETAVSSMLMEGYPTESVWEYLYTLGNTNFEEWRLKNPDAPLSDFKMTFEKISLSGALFDINKFNDVSKNIISKMPAEKVYDLALLWAIKYNAEWANILRDNKDYCIKMFRIDRENEKPRKDITKWSDIPKLYSYLIDDLYYKMSLNDFELIDGFSKDQLSQIFSEYLKNYNIKDDKTTWFNKIKQFCPSLGFASEVKEYKKNPENYLGHCGNVCSLIRVALTGRQNSLDLYSICELLGENTIKERLDYFLSLLK